MAVPIAGRPSILCGWFSSDLVQPCSPTKLLADLFPLPGSNFSDILLFVMKSPGYKYYFTITEAARKLRVTRAAVHEAIKRGKLNATWGKFIQVTEGWRISPGSLHDYEVSISHQERGKKTSLA